MDHGNIAFASLLELIAIVVGRYVCAPVTEPYKSSLCCDCEFQGKETYSLATFQHVTGVEKHINTKITSI